MICDFADITLRDGTRKPAIDVTVGTELLSFAGKKPGRALVRARDAKIGPKAIRLVLSPGGGFVASPDQLVAVPGEKNVVYRPLSTVSVGDKLRGERAGVPISLTVIGLQHLASDMRFVYLATGGAPYVASGVLCRPS